MNILRKLTLTLLATSALGLCLSCGGEEKAHDDHDGHDHAAETAKDVVDKAPAVNLAAGKVFYDKICAACHGTTGKGDGAAAVALNPKPRDLSDKAWQDSVDDAYVTKVIVEGGTAVGKNEVMAAFGPAIDNDESVTAADLVSYVRSLGN